MKKFLLPQTAFLISISIVIGFSFFGQIRPISAQTEPYSNTKTPSPTEIISITDSPSPTFSNSQGQIDELWAINDKVDIISEYKDRMMNTVQWSIGSVITIFTFMLFINWFTSYRQNKNELNAFKKTTLENITKDSEKLKNDLTETLELKFNEIIGQIDQKLEGTNKQIDQKLKDINKQTSDKLEDINKQTSDNFERNKKQIEATIESQMSSINDDILKLKWGQMKTIAQDSESEKIYTNAAVQYARMIILNPNHWEVNQILELLINVLTLCKMNLGPSYVQTIENAMDLFENKYGTYVDKIRRLVKEKA